MADALMTNVRTFIKSTYLSLFDRLANRQLAGKPRIKADSSIEPSIKVIARYGRSGGITNGAIHNATALRSIGYEVDLVDISSGIRNPLKSIDCSPGGRWIFHCDAAQFLLFAWPLRRNFRPGRIIGYFAWELAAPPSDWPNREVLWDEIWTPSRFAAESLAKHYQCPIYVVPHVVLKSGKPRIWRKGNEVLTFLTMADQRSSLVRKNPRAVVSAFQQAFPTERDVALTVKVRQTNRPSKELELLISQIAGDGRIRLITDSLDRNEVDLLLEKSHVYVSLHRAEGFGLPLLEARTSGISTIATAYSGNLDFMTSNDSVLVPFDLVTMTDDDGVYGTVTWAEPDISAAAAAMRRFYESPDFLFEIANNGFNASRQEVQIARFAEATKIAGLGKN